MNSLEQLRYYAASAGKTPEQIQALEQWVISSAKVANTSVDVMVYAALHMLEIDSASKLASMVPDMLSVLEDKKEGEMMSWDELNERQQTYMKAIYEVDQDQEQYERSMWTRGGTPRKAAVWRWMDYATLDSGDTQLKSKLRFSKLINEGTGSTFEALARRGLIKCRYSHKTRDGIPVLMAPGESILAVQITPAGRKLVREATGEKPVRQPPGTLQEWQWSALAKAYKARPTGLKAEITSRYGGIGWGTWLRLRDYKAGDLVQEHEVRRGRRPDGWYYSDYYIKLTPFGEQYYRDNWQRYKDMYPDVDAPEP